LLDIAYHGGDIYGIAPKDHCIYARYDCETGPLWERVSGPAVTSLAVTPGGSVYAVGLDHSVHFQSLDKMTTSSKWTMVAKHWVRSLAVGNGHLYGVGANGCVYAQSLESMAPESEWRQVSLRKGNNKVLAICIDEPGDTIYAIRLARSDASAGGSIYKKTFSAIEDGGRWELAFAGQRARALTLGEGSLFAILGSNICMQSLGGMTLSNSWTVVCTASLTGEDASVLKDDEDDNEDGNEGDNEDDELQQNSEPAGSVPSGAGLDSTQLQILRSTSRGAARFDPAVRPSALEEWEHLLQWCPVGALWNTHKDVCPDFKHGRHRGRPVEDLTRRLLSGEEHPERLPPLVAVQHDGNLWVVYGNRRLKALKEFAARSGQGDDVEARVIVHDRPSVPSDLFAKFVLAATTPDGRAVPPYRSARRRAWGSAHGDRWTRLQEQDWRSSSWTASGQTLGSDWKGDAHWRLDSSDWQCDEHWRTGSDWNENAFDSSGWKGDDHWRAWSNWSQASWWEDTTRWDDGAS